MAIGEQVSLSGVATGRSLGKRFRDAIAPILASKVALIGLGLVSFWILVAIFAPFITPYGPLEQDPEAINLGPSLEHLLGADNLGRDLWTRLIYGARTILILAPLSVLCALAVGATLGLISGYFGGWTDEVVMRLLDAIMAFPVILLYLIIIQDHF